MFCKLLTEEFQDYTMPWSSCADYDRVLMLLIQGASASARNIWLQTPLHLCVRRGDVHVMLLLLDSGAEVNAKDSDFVTPLYQAVVCGRVECLELLLYYGVCKSAQS